MDIVGTSRGRRIAFTVAALLLPVVLAEGSAVAGQPLAFSIQGEDARTRVPPPGATIIACSAGGNATHHHVTDQSLGAGVLSQLAGTVRTDLDLHLPGGSGFVVPEQSSAAITNERGEVALDLAAGSCGAPTVSFDGSTASGSGTWALDPDQTNGAYRQATGSGTFTFAATFTPGNVNPWQMSFNGEITVLQPDLKVELVRSYWGHLGADYAGRMVSVIYRLTNTGPGDAFNVKVLPPATKDGIAAVEVFPTDLDDLSAGEEILVTARYKIGIRGQRDGPLLVKRQFDTTISAVMPDALDVASTKSVVVAVTAPAYPPSL